MVIPPNGVNPSQWSFVGNTINPALPSNTSQHLGPNVATFTSMSWQDPSAILGNGDLAYCAVTGTNCLWTDTGYAYNAIPNADLAHSSITVNGTPWALGSSQTLATGGGIVAAPNPTFTPAAGNYSSTQSVSLTCPYGLAPECNITGSAPLLASCNSIVVAVSLTITGGCYGQGYNTTPIPAQYVIGTASIKTYAACDNYNGTATCAMNPTSGNFLVAYVTPASVGAASPLTPSGCVTWTQIGSATSQGDSVWEGTVASSGACNVTASNTTLVGILIAEVQNAVSTVDGTPGYLNSTLSGSTAAGASTTTTVNGDLILSFLYDGAATYSLNSPFTSTFSGNTSTESKGVSIGYDVQATAGAINPVFTVSAGSGQHSVTLAVKP